ncbi:MAG: ATP synthase F1 subunit epsilon [Candidatus Gastranaerophilales bacterium]|nr:ATP synthase F1 subunit epsilon [Candidatus Gastranaerophilales bacterium]
MEAKKLRLKVITPVGITLEEECDAVYSQGVGGAFGILPGHIPMTTSLDYGVTKYIKNGEEHYLTTLGGIFQVENNEVTILSDAAERGEDIDVAMANAEKERAEAMLTQNLQDDIVMDAAQASLAKALARLKVATKINSKNKYR